MQLFFIGKSYLAPITESQVCIFNVTFEPGCRNNWHVHLAIEVPGKDGSNEWLEAVTDEQYKILK